MAAQANPTPGSKLYHKLWKLDTSYNQTIGVSAVWDSEGMDPDLIFGVVVDQVFNASINLDPGTPKNDREAQKSPEWDQWKQGLWKEFDNFMSRDAWNILPWSELAEGAHVLQTKNVYKLKTDATDESKHIYKLRNVVLGYEQIPGVDYLESFAPLVTDTSVRVALVMSLYFSERDKDWVEEMLDVEAAFLNVNLGTKMYIQILQLIGELGFIMQEEQQK